jgi:hypothetical protein
MTVADNTSIGPEQDLRDAITTGRLVDLRQQDYWIPSGGAQWWAWTSIVAGWVLTSAVVAALTGIMRRD